MSLIDRARRILDPTWRDYRYEGEQEAHADQLRETEVSLSMMANADPNDPDQIRLATDIEHGAEDRLGVLLGKARLTKEEKRERDDIQRALAARRQALAGGAPVLVQREAPQVRPNRFLGALGAHPVAALLLNPWTWIVALAAFAGLQMVLKERVENQRDEARAELERMEDSRDAYARALGVERAARARDVAQVLEDTAETVQQLERQRARERARAARERSRHEDLATGSVNFTERLRELARPEDERLPAGAAPAPGGDPASALPTEPGPNADDGAHP